jgi:hypothetical protein
MPQVATRDTRAPDPHGLCMVSASAVPPVLTLFLGEPE